MFKLIKDLEKKLGRKFWAILGVLVLAVFFWIRSARSKDQKLETVKASKGDLVESISTSGKVKADEMATLTFGSSGKLSWVGVKEGDWVRKYQGIAGLDTVTLNATYQQALNSYKNLQAAAENVLDQVKDHSGDETFSQKATRTAAEVARDNAYDAMIVAKYLLDLATITSPFDGIVTEAIPSFPGINVSPAGASYTVVNPLTAYLEVEISESDLPKVKVGQKALIKLDAYPGEEFGSQVKSIGFVAFLSGTGGNAYKLRVNLPKNLDLKFKIGMEGDIEIILDTIKGVVKVPSTSIVNEADKDYVWKVEKRKLKKIEVSLGSSSTDETEIKSGINEGDEVISIPKSGFKEGQKI